MNIGRRQLGDGANTLTHLIILYVVVIRFPNDYVENFTAKEYLV